MRAIRRPYLQPSCVFVVSGSGHEPQSFTELAAAEDYAEKAHTAYAERFVVTESQINEMEGADIVSVFRTEIRISTGDCTESVVKVIGFPFDEGEVRAQYPAPDFIHSFSMDSAEAATEWAKEKRLCELAQEEAEELPTLGSLWGVAPNATGGVPAEEFISRLRRGEEQAG